MFFELDWLSIRIEASRSTSTSTGVGGVARIGCIAVVFVAVVASSKKRVHSPRFFLSSFSSSTTMRQPPRTSIDNSDAATTPAIRVQTVF